MIGSMPSNPRERIAVALDKNTVDEALAAADLLVDEVAWVKVATTLFTRVGPRIINELKGRGFKVFLDLKFHDIPAQVRGACRSAATEGADLLTVHCGGGRAMMEAAAEGALAGGGCKIVGVTVLTSLDTADLNQVGINKSPAELAPVLASLARDSGLDGVVCSPLELDLLRPTLPAPFMLVTPGIRPPGSAKGDQKRVLTPSQALQKGADLLVIGRPILNAPDPAAAARAIVAELGRA